jgi:hypothetical protein
MKAELHPAGGAPFPPRTGMRIPPTYVVGIDLGKSHDYTAIVVLKRAGDWGELIHLVRVEQIALETDYPVQVDYIRKIVTSPKLQGRCVVGVDGTGCGVPVVDMLRKALRGVSLTPLQINGSTGYPTVDDRGWHHVPKKFLITASQLAAQSGYLQVGNVAHRDVFDAELAAYTFKKNTDTGRETYANDARENEHDDLVLAYAIGIYVAVHRRHWGNRINPSSPYDAANGELAALRADPTGMLETWTDQIPFQVFPSRSVGRDPLAGWWNE